VRDVIHHEVQHMRIAVWHNLPSGGGKRALYDHVRGLVARGHTVEAWCPPTADRDFLPLSPLIRERVVDLSWPVPGRLSDKLGITLQTERSLASMEEHCRACAEEIGRGYFDILFANSCQFFRATSIGRFATIPSILYLQEPYRWLYEAMPRLRWLARPRRTESLLRLSVYKAAFADFRSIRDWRVQAREEVDNAAAFTRILVNSYFSRESVLRAYGLDSDVCYLGIDTDRFVDKKLPRDNVIVGLGSVTREKNLRLCIEAIGRLPRSRPKLQWVANYVDTDYLTEMRALANSLEVVFEPMVGVSDIELLNVLNRAVAMVYAPRLEPFGLAPLEANACGVPVIAVAEGGVRETIVDQVNGLLVEHNPAAIAAAIDRLCTDRPFACQLGTNARRAVEANWGLNSGIDRLEQQLFRHARRRELP
jgi:glycosyltransferase involved in cell wall biosynthesis